MNYKEALTEKSVKPSYIRLRIMEYLDKNRVHPTVDEIYDCLCGEIPTLSRTSVYNTLKLFCENGLALELTIDEKQSRFDGNTALHGHFKCDECGKIYDVPEKDTKNESLADFKIREKEVYYMGICKECLKKE